MILWRPPKAKGSMAKKRPASLSPSPCLCNRDRFAVQHACCSLVQCSTEIVIIRHSGFEIASLWAALPDTRVFRSNRDRSLLFRGSVSDKRSFSSLSQLARDVFERRKIYSNGFELMASDEERYALILTAALQQDLEIDFLPQTSISQFSREHLRQLDLQL